ncbi:hypothetical protein BH09BAC1_BH09BAC1_25350 [soil metagenome]
MLQIDWKVVYSKTEELYPRYKKGLSYSELEAELHAQGLDQLHINYVVEELNKKMADEQQKRINLPLLGISVLIALGFVVGLVFLFQSNYIILVVGVAITVFVLLKMVFRHKTGQLTSDKRWDKTAKK